MDEISFKPGILRLVHAQRQASVDLGGVVEDAERAFVRHQRLYREVVDFFTKVDFFVCPVTPAERLNLETEYPRQRLP
ncbi:MAG: hypothetical protein ABIT38_19390 [Gemmatimonadaceae bacterium]